MTASSLIKYFATNERNGDKLWWHRADIDHLPYRGMTPPLMHDDEFEARTTRVADAKNGFFDVTDPAQNKQYLEIMECHANGWFLVIHLERFWQGTVKHYVEWMEYFLQDGVTRTPHSTGVMELTRGQPSLNGHSG